MPLGAPAAAREVRKTVTVVFCDITGSTALGESVDPEALRALLAHYFERMRPRCPDQGPSVRAGYLVRTLREDGSVGASFALWALGTLVAWCEQNL